MTLSIEEKAALPGVTKKGIHEFLLHRYPNEGLPGYNAFTHFMRGNGIVIGPPGGPEPHPRFEFAPVSLTRRFPDMVSGERIGGSICQRSTHRSSRSRPSHCT